ncbi:MAG: hypothetical protein ACOYB7_02885 [Mycobacterium sp.]
MASDNPHPKPIKGDVIPDSITRVSGEETTDAGYIEMQLVGHPHRYRVRIDTSGAAPRLVELHLLPLDGTAAEIDPATIRQVPIRRLTKAAARFILDEYPFAVPGLADDATSLVRPDYEPGQILDDAHYRMVAGLLIAARGWGLSPRDYAAEKLNISKPTVDRYIKKAKDLGYLERDWLNNNGRSHG